MKLVLDTNILVSALLVSRGAPDQLYQHWLNGSFRLLTSRLQQIELRRVLSYPRITKRVTTDLAKELLGTLDASAMIVDNLPELELSPDPDDNVILATAIAGSADLLVSGDKKHLLVLKEANGIPIVTPSDALKIIEHMIGKSADEQR